MTSTGRRFPGNRHQLRLSLSIGTQVTPPLVSPVVESRTCAQDQEWADCAPTELRVRLTPVGTPQVVQGRDGRYAVTAVLGAEALPAGAPPVDPQAWGTIRLTAALAPGRVGVPEESIQYWRTGLPFVTPDETLIVSRSLRYSAGDAQASAPVSAVVLGTAPVRPWRAGDVDEIRYHASGMARGPRQAPCCRVP